jgi:hypothetical protein
VATEAAWLDGNNLEKEEIKKKEKNARKGLTLFGLLMKGAWGKARMADVALRGIHSTFSWNLYLQRKPVRSIQNKPSFSLAPEFIGVFNPRMEAPYVLSIMRVGQSGGTHRGDGRPFLRSQESGQTRHLGIPEAFGLLGLRLLSLHRSGKRISLYRAHSGN